MIITKKNSRLIKKVENRLKQDNLLNNKYLMIEIEGNHGFFSLFIRQLGWIDYALRHNMIPVVDMKNTKNMFLKNEEIGKINAYEYYFTQPGETV